MGAIHHRLASDVGSAAAGCLSAGPRCTRQSMGAFDHEFPADVSRADSAGKFDGAIARRLGDGGCKCRDGRDDSAGNAHRCPPAEQRAATSRPTVCAAEYAAAGAVEPETDSADELKLWDLSLSLNPKSIR